ncbi:MAG: hypothetical protein ACLFWB_03760 [Armatimonadota bacterium]
MISSDGNGNVTLSKASTISIGLAIALMTVIVGIASYTAAQNQAVTDHIQNPDVHWSKGQLDGEFMPRREIQAELRAIRRQLDRIESRLQTLGTEP